MKKKFEMKPLWKRALSMLLAICIVAGMVPTVVLPSLVTTAKAATALSGLTDTTLGLSYNGGTWTASGSTITGSVSDSVDFSLSQSATSSAIYIKNNRSGTIKLQYTVSSISDAYETSTYTTTTTDTKIINSGDETSITLAALSTGRKKTASITISDITVTDVVANFAVGEDVFDTLDEAIAAASASATHKTIVQVSDYTVPAGNYTIPSGVTLVLPYAPGRTDINTNEKQPYANSMGTTNASGEAVGTSEAAAPGDKYTNVTLTVVAGTNITVASGGKLVIGGLISGNDSGFSGQTYGGTAYAVSGKTHSDMVLDGTITVESGGILSSCGFITGDGAITVDGGAVYQPFVILDYNGGTYTAVAAQKTMICPFNRYAMYNIQTPITIQQGGSMYGYASLFTGAKSVSVIEFEAAHNQTTPRVVGTSDALFITGNKGTVLTIGYEGGRSVNTNVHASEAGTVNIGTSVYRVTQGSLDFGSMELEVTIPILGEIPVKTESFDMPIPHNFVFEFAEDTNGSIISGTSYKLLPGAEILVENGATFTVDGELAVYDGFADVRYSAYPYPDAAKLATTGISGRGRLVVDGTLDLNGTFSGLVECTGNTGVIDAAGTLGGITYQEGVSSTDEYNSLKPQKTTKTTRTIPTRVWSGTEYLPLTAGTYYGTAGSKDLSKDTFTYVRYTSVTDDSGNTTTTSATTTGAYAANETISGQWATDYTVTFEANGGLFDGKDTKIEVAYTPDESNQNTINEPENPPVLENYTFAGWFDAPTGGNPVTFPQILTRQDLTVYAQWEGNTVEVTLTAGTDAECDTDRISVRYGEPYGELPVPTKKGHTFLGWFTGAGDTGEQVTENTVFDGKTELFAHWGINSYTVTWIVDGESVKKESLEYGKDITKPGDPTKAGYTFVGWKDQGGNEPVSTMPDYDLTYTAQWQGNQITLSLDGNGEDVSLDTASFNVTVGDTYAGLANVEISRENYTFDGWYTEKEGGTKVTPETTVTEIANHTLYAHWNPDSYTVTLNTNGGTIADGADVTTYTYGIGATLPTEEQMTKTGYTFVGWYDNEKFSGTPVTAISATATGDKTYYAKWTINSYTVTWDVDGVTTEVEYEYGAEIKRPQEPSKEGYTFAGWTPAVDATMPDHDVTYTAQWTVNQYTITFNTDGGNAINSITQDYGTEVTAPADPIKTGYTFAGWDKEIPATMPAENVTITATWTINQYTITFDTDGGSAVDAITQNYGTDVTAPAAPTKTGYTFAGWDREIPDTMPAENVTIKAKWTVNQYTITFDTDGGSAIDPITQDYATAVTDPANPTKEGYTFAGWDKEIPDTMPAENVTIKANWTVNQYTITFETDGGSAVDAITQDYGTAVTAPAAPTKEGYTFVGWNMEVPATMPAENVTIEAQWTVNQYTITFDTDGGSDVAAITQDYGTAVTTPAAPTKTGYTFAGWDMEIPANMPAKDVTITAKWTVNIYNVTLMDGDSVVETVKYTYGIATVLPTASEMTKEGYTFAGWYTAVEGGTKVTEVAKGEIGAKTYYAKWTINSYTVTWDVNGEITTESYEYGAEITKQADPTKAGYDFVGWEAVDETGKTVDVPETVPAYSVTITAKWKVQNYNIRLNVGKGTLPEGADPSVNKDYGETYGELPEPSRTGYTFDGWTVGEEKVESTTTVQSNAELVATWTPKQYTVTFNAGVGSLPEDTESTTTVTYDSAYGALPTPTRTGYTFLGWYTIPQSEAVQLAEGEEISEVTADTVMTTAENHTLYAHWKINSYTITFEVGEGVDAMDSITAAYGSAINVANPTKTGYRFVKWTDGDGQDHPTVPDKMPAKDLALTAVWEINRYTITFDTDGGDVIAPITQDYNTDVTAPAAPTKEGHTFDGWDKAIPGKMPAEDVTITAQWMVNQYTITFDTDGGSEVAAITQDYNSEVKAPAVPSKVGYAFDAWYIDEACTQKHIFDGTTMPAHDFTLYAKWIANEVNYTVEYYLQNLDGTYPATASKTVTKRGKSGETTEAEALQFEGFTAGTVSQTTIAGDGTTVIKIYYTRNKNTVTFNSEDTTFATLEFYYGAEITAPAGTPTKAGYTFAGWGISENATMPDESVAYNAKWDPVTYNITYHLDGGENAVSNPATYTIETDTIILQTPTRTGYDFDGWFTEENGGGTKVTEIAKGSVGNVVLYAKWTPSTYKVKLVLNGGTINGDKVAEYTFGEGATLPAEVTREGHTFEGWFEAANFSGDPATEIGADETGDKTFYARWHTNQYQLVWDLDGGTVDGTTSYTHGDVYYNTSVTAPKVTKIGYTFAGWDKEIPTTMPAENVTITAKWTINQYTITFDTDGGNAVDAITQNYGTDITAPAAPTKEGYTFAGWDVTIPATMPAENVTITALWTVNQYTITFDTDGGSAIDPITQDYAAAVEAPADPTKEGYTFAGWDREIPDTMPAEDITITARWTVNQYTITFNTDGGSAIDPITQDYATAVTDPANPTKEGYTFAGWDKEIPATMPAENVTIKAKWTINQYTITFDTDGGSAVDAITQNYGTDVTAPAAPTKTGYTFDGWGAEIPATMPAEDITIKATWKINSHTVTWDVDGEKTEVDYNYGAIIELPATPEKTGYTFAGWSPAVAAAMPDNDVTYTATWTPKKYGVTLDTNGGNVNFGNVNEYTYGVGATLPRNVTRTGYTFDGWYADKDFSSDEVFEISETDLGIKTFYAKWTPNTYEVTLNTDGGTVNEGNVTEYVYGEGATLPTDVTKTGYTFAGWYAAKDLSGDPVTSITKTDIEAKVFYAKWTPNTDTPYTVKHYLENADGTWPDEAANTTPRTGTTDQLTAAEAKVYEGYTAGTISDLTIEADGSTVVEVRYTRNSYPLTVDGETVAMYKHGAAIPAVEDPVKDHYTFAGWQEDLPETMPIGGFALVSTWTPVEYTITYNLDNGEMDQETAPATYTIESETFTLPVPTRTGYTFTGWTGSNGSEKQTEVEVAKGTTGNLTYKANWSNNQYTVKFDANGGIGEMEDKSYKYDQTNGLPANEFTYTGHSFSGWNTKADGTGDAYAAGATVKNLATGGEVTLYAQWTANKYTVTFNANGGSGSMDGFVVTYGVTGHTVPVCAYSRPGYTFDGWNTRQDGSGSSYEVGADLSAITENLTLFAQWKANTYLVRFAPGEGGSGTMEDQSFVYGASQALNANQFTREGYEFVGWKTEGGTIYKDGEVVSNLSTGEPVVLTAQWKIRAFTITFDADGGTGVMGSVTDNYSTTVNDPGVPVKPGWRFDGWYDGDTKVEFPITMPAEDKTITARWTSYLSLLTDPATGFDPDVPLDVPMVRIAREYYSLMIQDPDQLAAYNSSTYVEHKDSFFAAIKVVATADLRESVESDTTINTTNGMLKNTETGEFFAELELLDAEGGKVSVWIHDGAYPATNLLTVNFLPALFNSPDIKTVTFPELKGKTNAAGESIDTSGIDQMDLMLHAAYIALADRAEAEGFEGYDAFVSWLKENMDITIGAMDNTSVQVQLNARTPEGIEYNVTYTLYFNNVHHNVIWDLGYELDGEAQKFVQTYAKDDVIAAPGEEPVREGYTFSRWDGYTDGAKMELADVTYTAIWTAVEYGISYDLAGGTAANPATYTVESDTITLVSPTRTGYIFDGWTGEGVSEPTRGLTIPAGSTGDKAFTAHWTPITYTVTYDLAGGALGEGKNNPVEYTVEDSFKLFNPTREGYTFKGWTGSNGMVEQLEVTVPEGTTGDLNYEANWTENSYTVNFDANGGSVATESKDVTFGSLYGALPVPSRTGYTFKGWFTAATGGEQVTAEDTVPSLPDEFTLYAQWTANEYTVAFNANGGSVEPGSKSVTFGSAYGALPEPTLEGHTFQGWLLNGEPVAADTVVSVAGGHTLVAQWVAETYTVTLKHGDDADTSTTITVTYGKTYAEGGLASLTREGYGFNGWFTAAEGGEQVRPGDTVPVLEANTTLYARWTLGAFGIIYENGDGSGETVTSNPSSYTVESADIVLTDPVRTGYTFLGWTGEGVTEPTKGLTIPAGSTGDKAFTAHWAMDTYTVTYDLDGGTAAGNPATYTVVSDTFTLADPTREGYTFLGWSGTGLSGMSMMVTVEQGSAGNRSYTANWQVNKHSITYYVDGKLHHTVSDVAFGTALTPIETPVKAGYTFSGWQGLPATMPDADVEVTGTFTANGYTVIFDGNGATGGVMADQTFTYDVPQKLTANAYRRTGYTFDGWYYGTTVLTDGSEVKNLATGGTVTLTAKWSPNKDTAYTVNHYWQNADDSKYVLKEFETLHGTTGSAVTPVSRTYLGFKRPAEQTVTIKADGTTVVDYYYDRQTFTLTWDIAGEQEILSLRYGATIVAHEDPVREGYTFTGWDQAIPATMPAEDLTITARWEENTYSIIYIVDGEPYKTVARNYGAAIALETEPAKEGYTFSGWSEAPATMPANDVTISGTFTANRYQVSYDPNYSGAAPMDGKTVTYDSAYGTLAVPSRTGYAFAGWTLDGKTVDGETVVKTAAAHTLVAQWTANTYTVTLDAGEGTVEPASLSVSYDSAFALPTPDRPGYNFGGWYNGDVQIAQEGVYTFTSDLELEAEWSEAGDTPYTVKYYLQDLDGKGYTLCDTEEFTGATNAHVRADQPARDGFTVNVEESVLTGTIAGDGSLVLEVYYDRDSYTVIWIVPGDTVTETYLYGQTLNVPATEWQDVNARYDFTGWNVALPETVTGAATYTAVYDTYYEVAVVNTAGETLSTYRTLEVALKEAAKTSGKLTLRLEVDRVLTEDITVPANVTLVLPCIGEYWACPKCNYAVPGGDTAPTCTICKDAGPAVKRWDGGYVNYQSGMVRIDFNQNGTSTAGTVGVGPNAYLYRELTVAEGVTMTINGTVMVNAVTGRPSGGHMDMDITGGYAQINLYGDIVVNDGGTLDCFGYIKGDGLVTARKGGTVGDLYIVRNWRGGSQAEKMFNAKVYPMTETDCHNIETTIRIEYGGSYVGLVKMNANNGSGNKYYATRFPQVDVDNGLIRLKSEDGYVIRSYDPESKRDTYEIYGGADFANSSLFIVLEDISTANFTYPIDGDMDFVLAGGDYTFVNDYKIMTGATFTVKGDATLTIAKYAINENLKMKPIADDGLVTVVFYDEFKDKPNTDGTAYPDRPAATLTLEEGAVFTNAGIFSGTIYTSEDNVFVEPGPVWEVATREADGYFNTVDYPYVVDLNFDLAIYREGYTWRFGEAARGEVEGSIIWIKDGSYGVSINGVESVEDGIRVSTEVYNTTDADMTCTLVIAAYDESGRMLAVKVVPNYAVSSGYANAAVDQITLNFNGTAATVRAFIMDENYVPLAPAASMPKG